MKQTLTNTLEQTPLTLQEALALLPPSPGRLKMSGYFPGPSKAVCGKCGNAHYEIPGHVCLIARNEIVGRKNQPGGVETWGVAHINWLSKDDEIQQLHNALHMVRCWNTFGALYAAALKIVELQSYLDDFAPKNGTRARVALREAVELANKALAEATANRDTALAGIVR